MDDYTNLFLSHAYFFSEILTLQSIITNFLSILIPWTIRELFRKFLNFDFKISIFDARSFIEEFYRVLYYSGYIQIDINSLR